MLNLATEAQLKDQQWKIDVEENAEHRAKIFIDAGNHEKAAQVLKELPHKKALVFLYNLGKKYLHHHDRRAETVVKTSELIEKQKIPSKEINLNETKFPHEKHLPIFKKLTVSEVFAKEV